jgi:hypothetical protein
MTNVSLMPVPSEQAGATCANCGAALVADQRYCLSCGQPASPVRLAFLDVLQSEQGRSGVGQPTIEMSPAGYVPVADPPGASGWLRRNSGLLGLFSVLLMCLIVGLLVGHWVTQGSNNKTPAKQVVEVKGLSGLSAAPAVAATTTPTSTTATSATATSKSSAKEEAEEAKAAKKETAAEKAPPPKPVKVAPATIKKLTTSSGKKHEEEINALGAQPIETG